MELNTEQRYWICWLYASTYNIATTWVLFNEFPDYGNVCEKRLAEFDAANKGRLPYQKDQKWLRGHLAPMYASLRARCQDSLEQHWGYLSYEDAWENAMSLYKVGRYTAWMFLQAISEVCGLGLRPTSLNLQHDSSKQPKQGLILALGRELEPEPDPVELDRMAQKILQNVRSTFPEFTTVHADYFSMETSLCAFSKLFRRKRGRYLGYYLDRWADDIVKTAAQDWTGINWDLLWECRAEGIPAELNLRTGLRPELYDCYLDTGEFLPAGPLQSNLNKYYYDRILRS
jgi:hypothetical protein